MVSTFCLRLAAGLAGSLLLLSPAQVNPRFFRTHFLVMLGLTAVALAFPSSATGVGPTAALVGAAALAFAGAVLWSLDGAPAGRVLIVLAGADLLAALTLVETS